MEAQRLAALDRANEVRFARARLKKEIGQRRRNPIRVLKDPPEFAENMKVSELLQAVPGIGKHKVWRLLIRCEVPALKRLGELTPRQRTVLARGIKEKAWLT